MTASPAVILIADDDRAIRTVLQQALGRAGHEVLTSDAPKLVADVTRAMKPRSKRARAA